MSLGLMHAKHDIGNCVWALARPIGSTTRVVLGWHDSSRIILRLTWSQRCWIFVHNTFKCPSTPLNAFWFCECEPSLHMGDNKFFNNYESDCLDLACTNINGVSECKDEIEVCCLDEVRHGSWVLYVNKDQVMIVPVRKDKVILVLVTKTR